MKQPDAHVWAIWAFALGYFLCYLPYSALAKALSLGRLPGMAQPIEGFALLPSTAIASLAGMFVFLTKPVAASELAGTVLVILAILVLAIPGMDGRRERTKARPAPAVLSGPEAPGGARPQG